MTDDQIRVLLVEDTLADVDYIRELLREQDAPSFEVEYVDSLRSGLERVAQGGIDVCLLDLVLPDSRGLDTVSTAISKAPDVPIVVLTGLDDEDTGIKAVKAGAQDYLIKGRVEVDALVRAIKYAIERKRLEKEKRELQAELCKSMRFEAIVTLAGGIAHDFNNALTGVMGNIELLKTDFRDDEAVNRYVDKVMVCAQRMAGLTNQLLAYARGGKYDTQVVSLVDFVESALPLMAGGMDDAICVDTALDKNVSNVEADLAQMEMVLSTVLTNAAEAIEGQGHVRVRVSNVEADEAFAGEHADLSPGAYVCLMIEDDGKGMDDETRSRIFEPFFSTKEQGRGLGMAAAYGIVINHNGCISVESELGKGTVIRIYLPAVEARVEEPEARETKAPTKGTGTILVIEDDKMVMEVEQAILESLGYRVIGAENGKEAIEVARTFDGDIDLAILDIRLPDIGGEQVYPVIMEARPNLKVVVCSGYTIDGPAEQILDAGAQCFIQKPYSIAALSEKLKEVLEGERPDCI